MKININQIPPEGLTLEESVSAASLDLETNIVNFCSPLTIKAQASQITNALTVEIHLSALLRSSCSRCLSEFKIDFKKDLRFSYLVNKLEPVIDLDTDIRDQVILDYPLKPLCGPDCKGLCLICGRNLNEGICSCESKIK